MSGRTGRIARRVIERNAWQKDAFRAGLAIYLLMKPLEWMFLTTLYLADRRPEDRIAKQYTYDGR